MCSFHPSTSPDTSSKGCSETSASSKGNSVQELIQELTKYAARMVQYPDDYSFRRQLIAALRPSLQKEVLLRRGITVEFSSIQDILEKAKDIEDSLHYDIRFWMSVETAHSSAHANQSVDRKSVV